jgi:hypothetical protein
VKLYEALNLEKNELVCFVGAGGKPGLRHQLLAECAQQGGEGIGHHQYKNV